MRSCSAQPLFADSNLPPAYWADRQLPDARQEAQAQALMQELRCLVCQGQSIADSDAELAGDMRDLVRRRIAAGEKPATIRAWLIQRYGTWISYKPTAEPAAWPLWLAPLALLLIGAWLIREKDSGADGLAGPACSVRAEPRVLWRLGVRQGMLTAAAAALMLGAAGYALQGRPGLRGAPASGSAERESRSAHRSAPCLLRQFQPGGIWLLMSEALARAGNTEDSVGILQNAVRRYPGRSAAVDRPWQCAGRSRPRAHPARRARLSPAAELAPGHPAPRFFYDLALVRSGGGDAALKDLVALMRENPGASWRPMVGTLVLAVALNAERPRSAAR